MSEIKNYYYYYNLKKRVIKRVLRYSAVGRRTVSDIQHYKG